MENPMNKWMIWGAQPYFWKHPYKGFGFGHLKTQGYENHKNPGKHVGFGGMRI